jgi:chorismate dehydratase
MLRVGTVPYVVARPLDQALAAEPGIELVRDVPARLVDSLRAGRLDVALVSSIELFRRPGYTYLDGMAVAGRGYVSSVQVFLRRPIEAVHSVALDPASRASAALTQIVWPAQGSRPEFREIQEGRDPARAGADAWLRIGDDAFKEYLQRNLPPTFNPAQAWTQKTGLPFVFACWIAREGVDLAPWVPAFRRAYLAGRQSLGTIIESAAKQWDASTVFTRNYLAHECLYWPGRELTPALLAWRDAAAELELCRGDLEPEPISVPTAVPS